jgi:hypothetical protein
MEIKNIGGYSAAYLQDEVDKGGRFVQFSYTISFIFVTFRRISGLYLIRSHENANATSLPYTLLSVFFGWWGIPWGPKYTVDAIVSNLKGGINVTDEVMAVVAGFVLYDETEGKRRS